MNDHAPERLLPIGATCAQAGVSRATIYRLMADGDFPAPVKIGSRNVWVESEVQAWIADRIAGARMGQSMGQKSAA